jgi:FtsP/CotA-like multicopper oxidase with cupredoxin domain
MGLSRRDALKLGLLGTGAVTLPVATGVRAANAAKVPASPAFTPFSRPLALPGVIRPVQSTATADFYEVTQTVARQEVLPGLKTTVWGYNGQYPGPTFAVNAGRPIVVTQRNTLTAAATRIPGGVATTAHPHGLDVTPGSDGHPLALVLPGGLLDHHYPNVQPAATLWYHDHAIDHTSRNVYMGLAGFYLISDAHERSLPLPKAPFDIPLLIQDRLFQADGSFLFPTENGLPQRQGVFGDVILVNGVPKPFLRVQRRRYRFRLLNGSDARIYNLRLSTGEPLIVIGSDGGLMPHPVPTPDLLFAPAERYEVVVDFSRYPLGTKVILQNTLAPDPFGDPIDPAKVREIMRFDVVEDAVDDSRVPVDLAPAADIDPAKSVRTRTWRFDRRHGAWTINGQLFDGNRIDATPKNGTTEIWEFVNDSGGWLHPIHVHLVEFKVLDRNGAPPRPYEQGAKDTVVLGPNETVRVAMRFDSFTGVYVMHCHNISHEDHMMMTQFRVVP